jgi:hypothetical protein
MKLRLEINSVKLGTAPKSERTEKYDNDLDFSSI